MIKVKMISASSHDLNYCDESERNLTYRTLSYSILNFSHLKLCLATATHNFKCLKMYVICEI